MRRLTLFISVALALLAFVIPATAGAKSHKRHHHARLADRNHNGMADRWEHKFRVHNGTNPRDADTDNDGTDDGDDDANHDGVDDGDEQSGVISTFDAATGKLTIKLVNGDDFVGTVNAGTEIECEDSADVRHDGESGGSGDNSGPGSTNSGDDDQGDDNDDQGEDEDDCGTDALTPGTIVEEAELHLTSGGAVFEEIELGGMVQA